MTRYSVLIVDDETSDRFAIKRMLNRCGLEIQVAECSNGIEALQYLEDAKMAGREVPDLILLDLNMPRVGGLEFLRRYTEVVSEGPQMHSPVLMMIASASREDENACMRFEPVKGIVSKQPDDPSEFIDAINRELAPRPTSEA